MTDDHWVENACDLCDRPLHPNAGAVCPRCINEMELRERLREGWAS
jgi:predicted amidophosphoribosyltransferase